MKRPALPEHATLAFPRGTMAFLFLASLISCSEIGSRAADEPACFQIGEVGHEITTSSPEAQLWFDRGLALCYGFNHEEALKCFQMAAAADPKSAMVYWGQAYALGPNYNAPVLEDATSKAAFESIEKARAALDEETDLEKALVTALGARFAWPAPANRDDLDRAYAEAMRNVHARFPEDPRSAP